MSPDFLGLGLHILESQECLHLGYPYKQFYFVMHRCNSK
jgi:hypothetical protein